jgi:hypothetical protein
MARGAPRFPGSAFFAWSLLLPLAMPAYVMAYAYTDFLQYAGPLQTSLREAFGWTREDYWFPDIRSVPGAAAMFVFTLYPYVFLLARTAFVERSPALIEAARTLGLDRRAAFMRVELPLARPAIAGGIALALMETLADFGTVAYFAGRHVHHGHLSRVVLARRPHGRGAAVRDAAPVRGRRRRRRARIARRSHDLRQRASAPRRRARAAAPDGGARLARDGGMRDSPSRRIRHSGAAPAAAHGNGRAEPHRRARYALWSYNSLRVALLCRGARRGDRDLHCVRATSRAGHVDPRERARAQSRDTRCPERCSRSACCCRSARSTTSSATRGAR